MYVCVHDERARACIISISVSYDEAKYFLLMVRYTLTVESRLGIFDSMRILKNKLFLSAILVLYTVYTWSIQVIRFVWKER